MWWTLFMLVPLVWAVQVHTRRRLFARAMSQACCPGCGASFSDALYAFLGSPGSDDLRRCDGFQRRYARYRIRCEECGAIIICTEDGPMCHYYHG